MTKTTKRVLACLLAALMLCAALPFTAFGAGDNQEDNPLYWGNYIENIDFAEGCLPSAKAEAKMGYVDITECKFPSKYSVKLLTGETITVDADPEVEKAFNGQFFDVSVNDEVTLTFNASMYYNEDDKDVKLALFQYFKGEKDGDDEYNLLWEKDVEAEIDEGNFLVRIYNWFQEMILKIITFFVVTFEFGG